MWRMEQSCIIYFWELLFPLLFVINIVALTAQLLIPLLFPLNCSYSNWDLFLLCLHLEGGREVTHDFSWCVKLGNTIFKPQQWVYWIHMIPVRGSSSKRARGKNGSFLSHIDSFSAYPWLILLIPLATRWICSIFLNWCVAVTFPAAVELWPQDVYSVMASDTVACSHKGKVSCSWKYICLVSAGLLFSPYLNHYLVFK